MTFYDNLSRICKEKNVTVKSIADKCYISAPTVSIWKHKGKLPSTNLIIDIANNLGVGFDELLGYTINNGNENNKGNTEEVKSIKNTKIIHDVKTIAIKSGRDFENRLAEKIDNGYSLHYAGYNEEGWFAVLVKEIA